MRQAGRSLPEYRELRARVDFLTLCRTPELAAQATIQPVERLDVDAAILFSDILVPAQCLGIPVTFDPGPVVATPVRTAADIRRLAQAPAEEAVPFVFETLRLVRRELAGRVPVIGFAGAPFTLAAYLVEGSGSRDFSRFKALLASDPATMHELLSRVSRVTLDYLEAQIRAGAQAVQLFDTWAGLLDRRGYREYGSRYAEEVLERLSASGVPRIYFALDASHLLDEIGGSCADVVGVDWRLDLTEASARLGRPRALQGNLDPSSLLAPPEAIVDRVARILEQGRTLPGHVFNLGHGVLPDTPVQHLEALVAAVRRLGLRS
jgi:uroporphyrinogen decarboxylase